MSDKTKSRPKQPIKRSNFKALMPFVTAYKSRVVLFTISLLFTSSMTLTVGQGVRYIIDSGFIENSTSQLQQAIGFLLLISIGMAIGTFVRFYLISWIGERVIADLRQKVFSHILKLHPSFFEENRSGEIMSRLTTDTTVLQSFIGSSLSIWLRSSITFFGALAMLLLTNFKLSMVIILGVPLTLLPILLFGKRVRKLSRKSQDAIAEVGSKAGEVIQQIKTVQSYTRESFETESFTAETEHTFQIARARIFQRGLLMAGVILLLFVALSAMLYVGGSDVISGRMTGGDLGAFIFYALLMAASVASLSEVISELQRASGATERLFELLHEKSLIASPEKITEHTSELAAGFIFDNVSFSYPTRPNIFAIKDFSLHVPAGKVLALVGPSGAGKTTLFELLQRFYDPQQGSIELGEQNKSACLSKLDITELREGIAVVSQQPSLFTKNVFENIRYGNPSATDEQVLNAAKAAHAHEFIEQLPEGYESHLGEQGVRLSGGQRQRIAIARAILKNPRILLLDEATSALDNESEWHVQQALTSLMENRTTLIIAHRLSTIEHADAIAVIDKGQLVGLGSHQELLSENALYSKLAKKDFT
ncbi:MAG: ATP-binding cassette domain-containing protein [Sinobacterium sp.]|nr:ATP-binding cassette domain-containing protein [Sinobacterium sp.]